jgi:manganese/zinc/iron transport system permease protein
LPVILSLTVLHAALSSVLGIHFALWLECSIAAAMVVMGAVLFVLAWTFSPSRGLLRRWIRSRTQMAVPEELVPVNRPI